MKDTIQDMIALLPQNHPLPICLEVAVPLWILQYRKRGGPTAADFDRIRHTAGIIAERGDDLRYREGSKKGEPATLFNILAEALAVMSFCPGGVRFCGTHYQSEMQS